MKTIRTTIITTLSLCIAAPLAYGQDPAALLAQCVKMPPGTPQQQVCITSVQAQMAVLVAQAAAAQAAAAHAAAGKAGAKPAPPTGLKAPDAPPDVKKAAQQLGLAGSPPPGAPGTAPLPPVNISGMDVQAALAAMMKQRADLLQGHLNTQIFAMQLQAAQLAAQEAAAAQIKEGQRGMQKGMQSGMTQAMVSLGSGAAGMQAVANMKNAGLDTSKISVKNVNGVPAYEMSAKQAEEYSQALDAKKKEAVVEQQKQADTMKDHMDKNKQALDVMQKYMDTLAATQAKIVGNMH